MKHKNIAYVYRSALINNYSQIEYIVSRGARELGEEKPRVICVVKADAYGHGIATTAGALGEAGCSFFAVSSEEEAAELRLIERGNDRHPDILILGHISPENVRDMLKDDIFTPEERIALRRKVLAMYELVYEDGNYLFTHTRVADLYEDIAADLMEIVRRIRKDYDVTILLIEHDMKFMSGLCDEITVLNFGTVLAQGTPEVALNDPEVIKAYIGG